MQWASLKTNPQSAIKSRPGFDKKLHHAAVVDNSKQIYNLQSSVRNKARTTGNNIVLPFEFNVMQLQLSMVVSRESLLLLFFLLILDMRLKENEISAYIEIFEKLLS